MKTYLFLILLFSALFTYGQWSTTNLSEAKSQIGATSLGTKAYFAGGTNFDESIYLSTVDIYDVKTKTWSTADLSFARQFLVGVSCGSKVFFAGGSRYLNSYDIVDIYDTITQKWTVEHLSVPRFGLSAVAKGNKVLFAGGIDWKKNIAINVVDIYDIQTGQWSKDTLSMARGSMGAAVLGDLAFFAGGQHIKGYTDRIDIYNFSTGKWTTDTLSKARGIISAEAVGNKVLIAGGMTILDHSKSATDLVDIYDAETGKWTTAKLSSPRAFWDDAATIGDKVYFVGGGPVDTYNKVWGASSKVIDIYDNKTGTWSVDSLPHGLINHRVTAVGNHLLVGGGETMIPFKIHSTVEIFTQNASTSPEIMDDQAFRVYPNPAKDMLTIAAPNGVTINDMVIYNIAGQKVLISKVKDQRVNVSRLPKGMYFMVMTSGQKQIKKKLIVE